MPRLENPKQQIIHKTQQLIQINSYKAITYDSIAKELGIKKASLYHHFKSKEDLGLKVIQTYRQTIKEQMQQVDLITSDPLLKLKAYFRFFVNIHKTTVGMCPAGVLSAEVNSLSYEMKRELQEFFEEHFIWLVEILEKGKQENKLNFVGKAENKAMILESSIQGGLLLARMLKDSQVFYSILKQLKEDLEISEDWSVTPKDENGEQIII